MKTYQIVLSTTHIYSESKEFASEDEAYEWATEQGHTVTLDDSPDWSFDDGTYEVDGVTEEKAA